MSISVGYGQSINHLNAKPDLKNDIYDLSTISISRYYPDKPATSNPKEVLSRSPRYCFGVSTKSKQETTAFRHSYYFDSKEEAAEEHRKLRVRLFDQLTAPLLERLKNCSHMSVQDQCQFDSIVRRIESLR